MVDGAVRCYHRSKVVQAVTGEEVSSQQLGGAMTHNSLGVAHYRAANEGTILTIGHSPICPKQYGTTGCTVM